MSGRKKEKVMKEHKKITDKKREAENVIEMALLNESLISRY